MKMTTHITPSDTMLQMVCQIFEVVAGAEPEFKIDKIEFEGRRTGRSHLELVGAGYRDAEPHEYEVREVAHFQGYVLDGEGKRTPFALRCTIHHYRGWWEPFFADGYVGDRICHFGWIRRDGHDTPVLEEQVPEETEQVPTTA